MDSVLIPNFIHNKGLSCTEKMVFAYVYKRIGNVETPSVVISTRDIAKFVELSIDAVTYATRKLESMGLFQREIVFSTDRHTGKRVKQIRYSIPLFTTYDNKSSQNIQLHGDVKPSPEEQEPES